MYHGFHAPKSLTAHYENVSITRSLNTCGYPVNLIFQKKILIHAAYPVKSFNTWSLPSEPFFSFSTKSLDTWRLPCDKIFRKKSHGNCWMLRVSDGDVHLFHSIPALNFYCIVCFKVVSYKAIKILPFLNTCSLPWEIFSKKFRG